MDRSCKGLFTDFVWGTYGTVSSLGIRVILSVFHFSIPLAATIDFVVSRSGQKWSNSNNNSAIGPICDTIKSTIAATGIEKRTEKNA